MGLSISKSITGLLPRRKRQREYSIGRHTITLPAEHRLDVFQKHWLRYDLALGEIARLVNQKYPETTAIDIGANIGDSAAAICKYADIPVLCIEGNQNFLPYLKKNILRLGAHVVLEQGFVGGNKLVVNEKTISTRNGTASITSSIGASGEADGQLLKTMKSVLETQPRFSNPRLIKIDTDGCDFAIICDAEDILVASKPVVFFEYYLTGNANEDTEASDAIDRLFKAGYNKHLVYDNFGNFIISADTRDRFVELNSYLRSNKHNGVAVYYLDICSFHENDDDLHSEMRSIELNAVPKLKKAV